MSKRTQSDELENDGLTKKPRQQRHPLIGKKIKMWFESDKMYYEAIVKSHLHDSTYNIMWVKEAAEEPMELKESDNTEDPANEDRWSVVTEPVYREDQSSDAPEEKDDGDDYKDGAEPSDDVDDDGDDDGAHDEDDEK